MLVQMFWGSDIPDHKIERDPSRHLKGSQQVQRCNVAKREIIVTIPYSFWWKKSAEQKIFVSLYLSKLLIGTLCGPCNNQLCATYTKNENKKQKFYGLLNLKHKTITNLQWKAGVGHTGR